MRSDFLSTALWQCGHCESWCYEHKGSVLQYVVSHEAVTVNHRQHKARRLTPAQVCSLFPPPLSIIAVLFLLWQGEKKVCWHVPSCAVRCVTPVRLEANLHPFAMEPGALTVIFTIAPLYFTLENVSNEPEWLLGGCHDLILPLHPREQLHKWEPAFSFNFCFAVVFQHPRKCAALTDVCAAAGCS